MSTANKIEEQDELHFATFQIVRWIDIFTRKIYAEAYLYSSARNYAGLAGVLDVIPVSQTIEQTKLMRSIK
jgi:hypothetical protein